MSMHRVLWKGSCGDIEVMFSVWLFVMCVLSCILGPRGVPFCSRKESRSLLPPRYGPVHIQAQNVCVCVCVEIDLALALKLCSFVVGLSYALCIAQDIAYIFHAYDVQRSLRNIKKNAFQIHRKWSQNPPQGPGGPSLGALGAKRPQLPFQQAPQMDTQMTPKAPRGYPKTLLAPFWAHFFAVIRAV